MVTEITTNRPYAPPSNVISLLRRLRSRNLPEKIDNEYLRDASIPEGTIARTLFALKFLNLINEANEPSKELRAIHTSTNEEYETILSGLIRQSYKDVFAVIDPTQDTQDRIINVFRKYTPASQRERMVIFFLGLCREAGIPTLDTPKQRPMVEGRTVRASARLHSSSVTKDKIVSKGIERPHSVNLSPALELLIRSLPEPGTPMSEENRKYWLGMAEATLKYIYPKEKTEQTEPENLPFEEPEDLPFKE